MLNIKFITKKISFLTLFAIIFTAISCAQGTLDPIDRQTGLRASDFNKILIKNRKKEDSKKEEIVEEAIPTPSTLMLKPPPQSQESSKTISFSVTEQVPLKDVLIELGRVAKIDIDLDPKISGGIVINARNRPLEEVIERIAKLGNLRYSYKNNILYFEKDTPFIKNYSLDYLSDGSPLWNDVQTNISAILNDSDIKEDAPVAAAQDSSDDKKPVMQANTATKNKSSLSINKSAGILYVFASQKQHDEVAKYLNEVQKNASAQVLIEAKMVEVTLKDIYKTGIDWNWAPGSKLGGQNSAAGNTGYNAKDPLDLTIGVLGSLGLNASVSALEEFGTTRTLSSPRIHAINNQKATLNFSDKFIYFKIDANQSLTPVLSNGNAASAVATRTVTSTKQEENIGVELNIVPSINLKTNEVTLNVRPKITVRSGSVTDPASPTGADGETITIRNEVPIIQTREINTTAKIQSGNIIVIGGLMKEETTNTDKGIPFLQRIPLIGNFFKSVSKDSTVVETVIFIKATIVQSGTRPGKIDREIQKNFDTNKRDFF